MGLLSKIGDAVSKGADVIAQGAEEFGREWEQQQDIKAVERAKREGKPWDYYLSELYNERYVNTPIDQIPRDKLNIMRGCANPNEYMDRFGQCRPLPPSQRRQARRTSGCAPDEYVDSYGRCQKRQCDQDEYMDDYGRCRKRRRYADPRW